MKKKNKITNTEQKTAVDILIRLVFAESMKEVRFIIEEIYKDYELCDDPFTKLPCTTKQYIKNRLEYERQIMIEKYGHCDGLD